MKTVFFFIGLFYSFQSFSQVNLLPMPVESKVLPGNFNLSSKTVIVLDGLSFSKSSIFLTDYLKKYYGLSLTTVSRDLGLKTNRILLHSDKVEKANPGAYTMEIDDNKISIAGDNEQGVFYGIQTLIQLLPLPSKTSSKAGKALIVPNARITDYPRFAYRGAHLDVCRHFFSVNEVENYIDRLAQYKFNTFHWHLTEDQGWRIEIKKYPRLTQVGGYRNGTVIGRYPGTGNDSIRYGGFYTQKQIKEVVKYAADRYIDVIPELELPGHASAAIAAYPQLSCFPAESTKVPPAAPWAGSRTGKQVQQTWGVFEDVFCPSEYTFKFLQDVLDEIIPLFPSKYVHIGGDECPKESWKRSEFCQKIIREKGLKDEHGLQSYFIQRMEKYINSKGKQIIGWDEILEGGLAPNATVMSWRGEDGGIEAARQNHNVIMTPGTYCYFDHSQSKNEDSVTIGGYLPLEKVYAYEPVPSALQASESKYVLGAQVNVWTEYIGNISKLEYMVFPRLLAMAEVLWSPKEKRSWREFQRRLPHLFDRLESQNINYSKAYYDLDASVVPDYNNKGILWKLKSAGEGQHVISSYYPTDILSIARPAQDSTGKIAPSGLTPAKLHVAFMETFMDSALIPITYSGIAHATLYKISQEAMGGHNTLEQRKAVSNISQLFSLNLASGKPVTLQENASLSYPGNGAFTLVDAVQNKVGLMKSTEFIGFNGKDLTATIDLLESTDIRYIALHVFEQTGSWIYRPAQVLFYISNDNQNFVLFDSTQTATGKGQLKYEVNKTSKTRFIKVVAKNAGIIPTGSQGAGNPAWLFVDEIEIN